MTRTATALSDVSFSAAPGAADSEAQRRKSLLEAGALQRAIFNSANFSSIATDAKGVIQIFNVGAERMLGYTAAEVLDKITPADISDPQEVIARAAALSLEFGAPITPGFEALVYKAARGIEDIYELTKIRKDGSRFPAVVSVTALRDAQDAIIGYLLIGTDNTARKEIEAERQSLFKIQEETNSQLQLANAALQDSEEKLAVTLNSIGDAVLATDTHARVTLLNPLAEQLTGWTLEQAKGRPVDEIFRIVNKDTRLPATIPISETLEQGTIQGLANHTVLISRDGSECDIADSCAPIRDRSGQVTGAVLVFRNVTGEYAVQQALRDSAALVQTILNTVVDGVVTILAQDGGIETANVAAVHMFGYTATELIGQSFSTLIPELNRGQSDISLEYYSASDEARAIGLGREVVGRRKDGRSIPLEMAVSEMWLGGQRYFTLILRDISARKHAEAALLKAGALQRAIFNSANFSSIATDAKGVIQIFNVGAERMLGYTAAEVVDKITPADISDPQEVIARARTLSVELETPITPGFEALVFKASRGIEDIYELTYIRKDGSRFPAVVSVTALRDAQDAIIGYLLIGTDNTARKEIEADKKVLDQRLRDQQFYTRSLIETSIDALMAIDPSGIITDVNKQMEALAECTRDELIGAPFHSCFTDLARAEECINLVLSEKKISNYELTARARSGKETVVSLNCTTFYNRDRKLQGVVAAARDITERRRDEELRAQIERVMRHDLRTPACNAINIARMIREETSLTEEQRCNLLCLFEQSGQNMLDTLNNSLDIYKIETGQYQLQPEAFDCLAMVLEIVEVLAETARVADIQQEVLFSGHPPGLDSRCPCLGRPELLRTALQNLLNNALEASPPGAVVVVELSSDSDCRIEIRNTGVVPVEIRERFFDKYVTEGKAKGTGLGTYSAKMMITAQGGDITMRTSDEQNETAVALRLPC